jgi:hypothetical protein
MINYNNLIDSVELVHKLDLKEFKQLSDEEKERRCMEFHSLFESDDLFTLFINSKIKLFSSKTEETHCVSTCLFNDDVNLKSLFNNQPTDIKNVFWHHLFKIYLQVEKSRENSNEKRVNVLENLTETYTNEVGDNVKNTILNVDVNETTDNMLGDIVGSFQSLINNDQNPFENIMSITNDITQKYQSKLESGEVELDKIIGGIQNTLPNMGDILNQNKKEPEKVVMDDNFSTADVKVGEEKESKGMNLSNLMGTMKSVPNINGLMDMVNKMGKIDTMEEAEGLKEEMNKYLAEDLGVDVNEFENNLKTVEDQLEKSGIDTRIIEE